MFFQQACIVDDEGRILTAFDDLTSALEIDFQRPEFVDLFLDAIDKALDRTRVWQGNCFSIEADSNFLYIENCDQETFSGPFKITGVVELMKVWREFLRTSRPLEHAIRSDDLVVK
ncbi:hypothetical protein P873_14390 [Arenimonas composti TR7-09 = DSM 18010]|uniref:Uncharacterized protein n=1 Tax=Arenimonas composti TR7-09 = DSM 18010 TaxID=1121013 RepID=A0A091B955_9GAMM|nr:hypothetical protein P873_14390 [Arenimonas composti TR7-09 = DSM 18010]